MLTFRGRKIIIQFLHFFHFEPTGSFRSIESFQQNTPTALTCLGLQSFQTLQTPEMTTRPEKQHNSVRALSTHRCQPTRTPSELYVSQKVHPLPDQTNTWSECCQLRNILSVAVILGNQICLIWLCLPSLVLVKVQIVSVVNVNPDLAFSSFNIC